MDSFLYFNGVSFDAGNDKLEKSWIGFSAEKKLLLERKERVFLFTPFFSGEQENAV